MHERIRSVLSGIYQNIRQRAVHRWTQGYGSDQRDGRHRRSCFRVKAREPGFALTHPLQVSRRHSGLWVVTDADGYLV